MATENILGEGMADTRYESQATGLVYICSVHQRPMCKGLAPGLALLGGSGNFESEGLVGALRLLGACHL